MKQLLTIFLGITVLAVFTGCSNRTYSHLTGWNPGAKAPQKKEYRASHYVKQEAKSDRAEEVALSENDEQIEHDLTFQNKTEDNAFTKKELKAVVKETKRTSGINKIPGVGKMAVAAAHPYKALPQELREPIKEYIASNGESKAQKNDGGLLYWILVVLLIILLLTLIREILGPYLYGLFVLVLLILLVLHLLGMI